MIKKIKLKHLPYVEKENLDIIEVISVLNIDFGFRFGRNKRIKAFIEALLPILEKIRSTDPTKAKEVSTCLIKRPVSIDDIPLSAMIEVRMFLDRVGEDVGVEKIMAETIAIICFSSNYKQKFSISSNFYKEFVVKILNQPILDMFGLFTWVNNSLRESEQKWSAAFDAVRVDDAEYEEAGGGMLGKFNVVETVKDMCEDFNVTIDEAWQLPYALSQTNSLAKATRGWVQTNLVRIKERKIKQQRGNP